MIFPMSVLAFHRTVLDLAALGAFKFWVVLAAAGTHIAGELPLQLGNFSALFLVESPMCGLAFAAAIVYRFALTTLEGCIAPSTILRAALCSEFLFEETQHFWCRMVAILLGSVEPKTSKRHDLGRRVALRLDENRAKECQHDTVPLQWYHGSCVGSDDQASLL